MGGDLGEAEVVGVSAAEVHGARRVRAGPSLEACVARLRTGGRFRMVQGRGVGMARVPRPSTLPTRFGQGSSGGARG